MGAEIHYREWGEGPPVLALHGLGVESSSFTGLGEHVAASGCRLVAADLPGFGMTVAPEEPLTPARLAESVVELAVELDRPLIVGMSLGARVALEAALLEPAAFRGAVMIAAPFPRLSHSWAMGGARLLSPELARSLPIQWAWPLLKVAADRMESDLEGHSRHDWLLRSSRRAIYYVSCPATRWAMVSAARELALDPATGADSVWARLGDLQLPAAFVWGERDRIIDTGNIPLVEEALPGSIQVRVPCAGHFDNGPHFLCMEAGVLEALALVEAAADPRGRAEPLAGPLMVECRAGHDDREDAADDASVGQRAT